MSGMGPPVITGQNWMRDVTRRLNALERRAMPSATDLLGPGLAPLATPIADWNDEGTLSNGIYVSAVGAVHGPDSTRAWIGWTLADTNGGGYQRVTQYDLSDNNLYLGWPGVTMTRAFSTADNSAPLFTAWKPENFSVQQVQDTDATVNSTSPVTVPNLTTSLVVPSLDAAYLFSICLDVEHTGPLSGNIQIDMMVASAVLHSMFFRANTVDVRTPVSFVRRVTGFSPGSTTFAVQASLTGGTDPFIIRATNSLMSVTRIT